LEVKLGNGEVWLGSFGFGLLWWGSLAWGWFWVNGGGLVWAGGVMIKWIIGEEKF
jgi:hypothetical protein